MIRLSKVLFVSALISIGFAGRTEASTITCPTTGSPDRQVTVSNAIACVTPFRERTRAQGGRPSRRVRGTWFEAGTFSGSGEGTNAG